MERTPHPDQCAHPSMTPHPDIAVSSISTAAVSEIEHADLQKINRLLKYRIKAKEEENKQLHEWIDELEDQLVGSFKDSDSRIEFDRTIQKRRDAENKIKELE